MDFKKLIYGVSSFNQMKAVEISWEFLKNKKKHYEF